MLDLDEDDDGTHSCALDVKTLRCRIIYRTMFNQRSVGKTFNVYYGLWVIMRSEELACMNQEGKQVLVDTFEILKFMRFFVD